MEALSVYKPARADQSAAEAGGTRDRRRNKCPTRVDEHVRRSVKWGHRRGREDQRGRHLLEQKWVHRRKVGADAIFLVIRGRTDTCPSLLEQLHDVNHDDDHDDDQEANSAPSAASNSASTANNASSSPNSVGSMSLCTTSSAFAGAGE